MTLLSTFTINVYKSEISSLIYRSNWIFKLTLLSLFVTNYLKTTKSLSFSSPNKYKPSQLTYFKVLFEPKICQELKFCQSAALSWPKSL